MGPPRERDGEAAGEGASAGGESASLGPPRERDGETQGGRRSQPRILASMGPPRERDGERLGGWVGSSRQACFNGAAARTRRRGSDPFRGPVTTASLQWGRRANATER